MATADSTASLMADLEVWKQRSREWERRSKHWEFKCLKAQAALARINKQRGNKTARRSAGQHVTNS